MVQKTVTIMDFEGIHARNSAKVVMACKDTQVSVTLEYQGKTANGTNILEIMSLGARYLDKITIKADGIQEKEILKKIEQALNGKIN